MPGPLDFTSAGIERIMRALSVALSLFVLVYVCGCVSPFREPGSDGGVDFTMSATPGSRTVVAGKGASFSVAFDPPARVGFVNFSVSGLPQGVTAAFSPDFDVLNGAKTLNVFTTTNTPPATAQLTITASDSSGSRTATVGLTITPAATFAMSVTPNTQTVKPGMSANYTVNLAFTGSKIAPVTLSVAGLPPGATASFDSNPLTTSGLAILTLTAGPQIITAIAPMNVIGSDGDATISVPIAFDIIPADFSLNQSVGPVEVNAGGTVTGQINVVGLFATPGTVSLSASGLPAGITATFSPGTLTGEGVSTVNIATDGSTIPGDYNLTINGVDASGQNLTTIPFTVVPGNAGAGFFLSAAPISEQVTAGNSAFYNIRVSAPGGTIPPLTFTVSSSQGGITGDVFPTNTGPGSFGLDLATSSFLGDTAATVTVTATGPNGTQSISVNLLINSPPPTY